MPRTSSVLGQASRGGLCGCKLGKISVMANVAGMAVSE